MCDNGQLGTGEESDLDVPSRMKWVFSSVPEIRIRPIL
jgi:hypothetical protein